MTTDSSLQHTGRRLRDLVEPPFEAERLEAPTDF
jgi:hypothetical protein